MNACEHKRALCLIFLQTICQNFLQRLFQVHLDFPSHLKRNRAAKRATRLGIYCHGIITKPHVTLVLGFCLQNGYSNNTNVTVTAAKSFSDFGKRRP
jgi:hypothetical protein